jgi:hypothetical protein
MCIVALSDESLIAGMAWTTPMRCGQVRGGTAIDTSVAQIAEIWLSSTSESPLTGKFR